MFFSKDAASAHLLDIFSSLNRRCPIINVSDFCDLYAVLGARILKCRLFVCSPDLRHVPQLPLRFRSATGEEQS
jgi:hypothetical protein